MGDIATGLFCVCATLGVLPLVRCPRGGAAEGVAAALDVKLREALTQRGHAFGGAESGAGRPVLCLFERTFDVASAVAHGWGYASLVADVLGLKLNRVAVGSGGAKKLHELDGDSDPFWAAHSGAPFPKVAEEVEAALQRYKADVAAVNRAAEAEAAGGGGGAPVAPHPHHHPASAAASATGGVEHASLLSAVSSLPELAERKKTIDKHTGVATACLTAIKARQLDAFVAAEEEALCGRPDAAAIAALLQPDAKGDPSDKLRLALVAALSADAPPGAAEAAATDAALAACGCGSDASALAYVRSLRAFNLAGGGAGSAAAAASAAAAVGGGGSSGGTGASQGALLDWADKLYGQGLTAVAKGVGRLLASGARQPPVARAVDALLDGRPGATGAADISPDTWPLYDARSPRPGPSQPPGSGGGASAASARPSTSAIVFVIGGGCYAEARALAEAAAARGAALPGGARTVLYGATDMLSPCELLAQLAELGRKAQA